MMLLSLPRHPSKRGSAALLLATLLSLAAASAQAGPLYGAIAGGTNSNRWGIANNHATQAGADQEALTSCASSDCAVQLRFGGGQCGAIATTAIGLGSTGYGIGTKDEAFDNAIGYCTVGLALCSVDSWRCNAVQAAAPVAPAQPYYAPPQQPINVAPRPAPVQPRYAPIVAAHSGKCLDVPNGSTADNVQINQYHCDGSNEQNFGLIPAGSGYYNVVAAHSGKCLDVPNGSLADNVQINQYHCDGSNEQRFTFRPSGAGFYNIVAAHSGKCLDVPNASTADNVQINQYQCDGSNEQRFRHAGVAIAAPAPPPPTYAPPQPAYAPPPPALAPSPSTAPTTGWTGKVTDPDGSVHRVTYDLNAIGPTGVRYIAMTHVDTGDRINMYGFSAWPTSRAGVLHFQANPPGEPPATCSLNLLNSSHISYDGFCNIAGDRARVTMDGP